MKNLVFAFAAVLLFAGGVAAQATQGDLTHYVNPLQGTNSDPGFSTGNNYPAVAVPWGMNFWVPQTGKMGDGWQYTYNAQTICGFKQSHQPSPWINDFGCFSIMPTDGSRPPFEKDRASRFTHTDERARPHCYSVGLTDYRIWADMTASSRGAAFRFTYPAVECASIVVDCYNKGGFIKVIPGENKIVGFSHYYAPNCGAKLPENFGTWFVITFDKPIELYGTWKDGALHAGAAEQKGDHVGAWISFKTVAAEVVELKVASSFISLEQAQLNYDREVADKDFAALRNEAAREWNALLGRTTVQGGTEEQKRTFYTALYRTMLFPHSMCEIDKNGQTVHYSPFLGTAEKGPMYTGNGFWDTFRAVHPYISMMYPKLSADIVQGLACYYREGGWIPEWFSPGYKGCMIGQNSASVIADAYLKGIRGFDIETLWEGIQKGANNRGPNATGRDGWEHYNRLGYVPYNTGNHESVSKTLEYAYDDYCIWRLGEASGKPKELTSLHRKRAENYANVFNPATGFVTPKDDRGNWQPDARPDAWGGSFTEGSSWHWTWCVFHDPQGLINLMGGEKNFVRRLDSVFTAEPTFDWTAYGGVIHEMTEMVACDMGQYAHGNQPIQHMIYLYNYAGVPHKAQYWVRRVMDRLYRSGIEDGKGLCGDEDNGQTSAWYVYSALGFYPVCPGSLEYVIGSPLFEQASITLDDGRKFTVTAKNNSPQNVYIQSARLNGKPFDRTYIRHDEIMAGGALEFVMGPKPNPRWASSPGARPYSMTARQ